MAQITTDNLGKQTLTLTIESVENRNAKTNWVKVAECPKKLIAWKESKVYDVSKLVAGASDEAEIEVKDEQGQDGDTYRTVWINRFGPAVAKSGGNFGGGGGGARAYQPKTKEEIPSASICGILKSCIEHGKDQDEAKVWLTLYAQTMKVLGGGA